MNRYGSTARRGRALAALAAAWLLAAGGAARPQEGPPPEALPGVFGEIIEVRVINLEVVVTDRQGNRVTGLTRDDFVLRVDGQEVPIDYFTEVRGGIAIAGAEAQSVPEVTAGRPVGTSYLLFIDNYFAIPRDRDRVLRRLEEDLARLAPEDRMAVVAYDGHDLEMVSTWSGSMEELKRSLEQARQTPARGLQRLAERQRYDFDRLLLESGLVEGGSDLIFDRSLFDRLSPEERFNAGLLADQVQRSIAAATATLRSFAAPPGRKVMLLLSGGWPFLPAEFVVADFSRPIFVEPGVSSGEDLFRPLTDTANLLGYTLYPVDVPGLEAESVDVSHQSPQRPGFLGSPSFARERENEYTLQYLAEKTGGRALLNAGRERALEEVVADTRSYYWLGFTPQRQGDDQRHQAVVEVKDPKLEVRSRSGFLDFSRQREVTMQVESALMFGNPPSTEPLLLEFGRSERSGFGKVDVPVTVSIPIDAITLLPGAGGQQVADLELRVAVMDEAGRQADVPVIPVRLELDEPPKPGQLFRYDTRLKMRKDKHRVVVAIYDRPSGRILSGSAEVAP